MLKTQSKKVEHVGFSCPWCGKWHRVSLSQEIPAKPDPYDDFLIGPPSNRITCKCGADLLILGPAEDFDVIWCNKKKMIGAAWLRPEPFLRPRQGLYYDLVRVPHGHVPTSKVWLWRRFPLLVKEFRGDTYFKCPECGAGSFFKASGRCQSCGWKIAGLSPKAWAKAETNRIYRLLKRERRDYFRRFLKDLEVLFLPVLALTGNAWYVRSERTHYSDKLYYRETLWNFWRRFG